MNNSFQKDFGRKYHTSRRKGLGKEVTFSRQRTGGDVRTGRSQAELSVVKDIVQVGREGKKKDHGDEGRRRRRMYRYEPRTEGILSF